MRVSYKDIRRVTPCFVDYEGRLTMDDLLDEDQCKQEKAKMIFEIIKRGQDVRSELANIRMMNSIKFYRKARFMSQEMLGEVIGISKNAISALERGVCGCSAYTAAMLCKALGCQFSDLFYLSWDE